jgi:hypothetical protein
MKRTAAVAAALTMAAAVAGCAPAVPRPAMVSARPVPMPAMGLERVLGQDAAGLVRLFGQPDADVREGTARKLQFQGQFCVLDAYLYPKGSAPPRVTYLDAREPDGSAIDRASCVAALTRRDGGVASGQR